MWVARDDDAPEGDLPTYTASIGALVQRSYFSRSLGRRVRYWEPELTNEDSLVWSAEDWELTSDIRLPPGEGPFEVSIIPMGG